MTRYATCVVSAKKARANGEPGFPWPWRRWWWDVTRLFETGVPDEHVAGGWALTRANAHSHVQIAAYDDHARICETIEE